LGSCNYADYSVGWGGPRIESGVLSWGEHNEGAYVQERDGFVGLKLITIGGRKVHIFVACENKGRERKRDG